MYSVSYYNNNEQLDITTSKDRTQAMSRALNHVSVADGIEKPLYLTAHDLSNKFNVGVEESAIIVASGKIEEDNYGFITSMEKWVKIESL